MDDRGSTDPIARAAHDWLVRIQLGDASGPGETAGQRMEALREFEAWRAASPAHAAAFDALLRSLRQTDRLRGGAMVAGSHLSRESFPRRHPWLSTAIAASIVLVAGFTIRLVGDRLFVAAAPAGGGAAIVDFDALKATRVGETRRIDLPDGSTVLLDTDSQVRIRYSGNERRLRLDRGRARFTVAHDATRPFLVEVGDSTVIAHGTIFDVMVSSRGVHVALLRGAIEVRRQLGDGPVLAGAATARNLAPGEAINLVPAQPMPMPQAVGNDTFDWPSGRLAFRDTPLVDAVEAIDRYAEHGIALGRGVDGRRRISGGFDVRAPRAFADAVALALGLRVEVQPDGGLVLQQAATGHTDKSSPE
jgi:transmembrane sensor